MDLKRSLRLDRAATSFTGRLLTCDIVFSSNRDLCCVSLDSPESEEISLSFCC